MNHKNPNGSRSGDIVLIMDGSKGYLTVNNSQDAHDGWHGGPTVAESHVPMIFAMPGDAFVDSEGAPQIPPELRSGFNKGVTAAGIKADGHLRNWHLTPILNKIMLELRGRDE